MNMPDCTWSSRGGGGGWGGGVENGFAVFFQISHYLNGHCPQKTERMRIMNYILRTPFRFTTCRH